MAPQNDHRQLGSKESVSMYSDLIQSVYTLGNDVNFTLGLYFDLHLSSAGNFVFMNSLCT